MNFPKIGWLGLIGLGAVVLAPVLAVAQPTLGVANVNTPCDAGPKTVNGAPDTVVSIPDTAGFVSLFDGKSLKGWWEGCGGSHATDKTLGGIFIADSTNGAIYSMQSPTYSGGVLTTNKSYSHYEMIFEFWSGFKSDAGVFNRTPANWRNYQTTLDYIDGSSVGGAYGENSFATHNVDYYTFVSTGGGASITNAGTWTTYTASHGATSLGCPSTGCTAANWGLAWDAAGWNQIRIKFYGGLGANTRTKMQAWIRKSSASSGPWFPTYNDSILHSFAYPANPIGLQIHSGSGRWNLTGKGGWYRNIKIRPLDSLGTPIAGSVSVQGRVYRGHAGPLNVRVVSDALVGEIAASHEITVSDLKGRVLEKFSGNGGPIHYRFGARTRGILMLEIKTSHGTDRTRINRV